MDTRLNAKGRLFMHGHEEWLRIAKEDLLAAKALVKIELFSAVVYHCQQSSEKLLKAYLVFIKTASHQNT